MVGGLEGNQRFGHLIKTARIRFCEVASGSLKAPANLVDDFFFPFSGHPALCPFQGGLRPRLHRGSGGAGWFQAGPRRVLVGTGQFDEPTVGDEDGFRAL